MTARKRPHPTPEEEPQEPQEPQEPLTPAAPETPIDADPPLVADEVTDDDDDDEAQTVLTLRSLRESMQLPVVTPPPPIAQDTFTRLVAPVVNPTTPADDPATTATAPMTTVAPPSDQLAARAPHRHTLTAAFYRARSEVQSRWPTGPMTVATRDQLVGRTPPDPDDPDVGATTQPTPTPRPPDFTQGEWSALPGLLAAVYDARADGKPRGWLEWKAREWTLRFATWRMACGGRARFAARASAGFRRDVERGVERVVGLNGAWRDGLLYKFARGEYGVTLNADATCVVFASSVRARHRIGANYGDEQRQRYEDVAVRVRAWRAPRWVTDAHETLRAQFGDGVLLTAAQALWWSDPHTQVALARWMRESPPPWRVARRHALWRALPIVRNVRAYRAARREQQRQRVAREQRIAEQLQRARAWRGAATRRSPSSPLLPPPHAPLSATQGATTTTQVALSRISASQTQGHL